MVRRQVAAEIEAGIKILRAAASDLEARPIEGLSADAAEALLQFAERIRAGIAKADTLSAAQRRDYEMLRLYSTLGGRAHFTIEVFRDPGDAERWLVERASMKE